MGSLPSLKLLIISIIIVFGGPFHFGFQSIVTNPAQKAMMAFVNVSHYRHYGWELSRTLAQTIWSITVAILSVGAVLGSLSISYVGAKVGRKKGLYVSSGINIVGTVLAIISYHVCAYELYMASRVIIGFATSLSIGLAAMLLNESSPKKCRGFISMMSCQAATGGAVVAAIVAMPSVLGTEALWWYLYLLEILMLIPMLAVLPFLPESPGFLALHEDEKGARRAILFYHGCKLGSVDAILREIIENIKLRSKSMSIAAAFKDKYTRNGILVGITISSAMTFSGSSSVNAFAVSILMNCGLKAQEAAFGNIGLMATMLVFSTLASFAVDRYGRRPLVLTSSFGLTILNVVVFALMYCFDKYMLTWLGYILLAVIAITKFFFAIGVGPLCFFVASEMVGQAARGVSQTCATTAQMLTRTICLAVFLPLNEAVGQSFSYLILFVAPMAFSFVYLYFQMPETKNRSHKEVIEAMDNLPSFSRCLGRTIASRRDPEKYHIRHDTFNYTEKL